jgi:hypothetical protein
MVSIYSQREALERSKISDFLDMAQFDKRMAEKEKESIEWLVSRVGRHPDETEKPAKPELRETPPTFSISVIRRDGRADGGGLSTPLGRAPQS